MSPRRTLLAAARRAGIPIGYPCRGEGVCGRCTVAVLAGADCLRPADAQELALLAHLLAAPGERIACLAEIVSNGRIVIRVGGGTYEFDGEAQG